jgi:hypothetical protein
MTRAFSVTLNGRGHQPTPDGDLPPLKEDTMHIPGLSDQSLKDLHVLIAEKLAEDDKLPSGKKVCGVREYPDWRRQADAFEGEMRKRKIPFTPIKW